MLCVAFRLTRFLKFLLIMRFFYVSVALHGRSPYAVRPGNVPAKGTA